MTYDHDDALRDEFYGQIRRELSDELFTEFEAERLKRMSVTIFYSWQSDTPNNLNRGFIEKALRKAVEIVGADAQVQEAVRDGGIELDKDTQGVAGTPPIADVIFEKISKCSVFVPDFTFTAKSDGARLVPNPNVLIEYGWAVRDFGYDRMLPVMNTAFGRPEGNLPFDMRHLRHPITYCLAEGTPPEEITPIRDKLVRELADAIKLILRNHGPRTSAPSTPEPPSFVAQAATLGPSQYWERINPFGVLVHDPSVNLRFDDNAERLFLRLIPSAPIDPITTTPEAIDLVVKRGPLHVMTNGASAACLGRNTYGVVMCTVEPLETDKNWAIVTNSSQVFMTRELWGIDARTINSKRLKEAAGVDFGFFPAAALERTFTQTLKNYLDFANRTLQVPLSLKVQAGATNVERYRMSMPGSPTSFDGCVLERNVVFEGEIRDYSEHPIRILRPFFDLVWEKCGLTRPDVDTLG
jgi:hypothetical protein